MATACSFLNTPLRRAAAWTLGYAVFRLLASLAAPVPFTVPLDPLAVCLAALLAEERHGPQPALRFILLAAMLAGDLATGLSAASLGLRLLGAALLIFAANKEADSLTQALRFAVAHALWSALAPELRGEYPLPYLYSVTLIQSLLFIGLLIPLLPREAFRPGASALLILGLPLAVFGLWLLLEPFALWPPPTLGRSSGLWMRLAGFALLIPPLLPLLPRNADARPSSSSSSRPARSASRRTSGWRDLLE